MSSFSDSIRQEFWADDDRSGAIVNFADSDDLVREFEHVVAEGDDDELGADALL